MIPASLNTATSRHAISNPPSLRRETTSLNDAHPTGGAASNGSAVAGFESIGNAPHAASLTDSPASAASSNTPIETITSFAEVMQSLVDADGNIFLGASVNDFALVGPSMIANVHQVSRRVNVFEYTPLHLLIQHAARGDDSCSEKVKRLIELGADVNKMSTYNWSVAGGYKRIPPLKLAESLMVKLENSEDAEFWAVDDMREIIEHLVEAGATTDGAVLKTCDSDEEGATDWDSDVDDVPGRSQAW